MTINTHTIMILWGTGIVINPLITFWVTRRHTLTITQTHDDSFYMYTRFAYMVDVLNIHGMQLSTIQSEMPNISLSPDEISNRRSDTKNYNCIAVDSLNKAIPLKVHKSTSVSRSRYLTFTHTTTHYPQMNKVYRDNMRSFANELKI